MQQLPELWQIARVLRACDTIIKLCLRAQRSRALARNHIIHIILYHTIPYNTIHTISYHTNKVTIRTICTISTIPYVPYVPYPRYHNARGYFPLSCVRIASNVPTDFVPKLGLPIVYQNSVHTTSTVTTVPSIVAWPSTQQCRELAAVTCVG